MKLPPPYPSRQIRSLRLLLRSIARELQEREQALERLADRRRGLRSAVPRRDERRLLTMEMAMHLREIRYAKHELHRLGCSVISTSPVVLGVPTLLHGQVYKSLLGLEELDHEPVVETPETPAAHVV